MHRGTLKILTDCPLPCSIQSPSICPVHPYPRFLRQDMRTCPHAEARFCCSLPPPAPDTWAKRETQRESQADKREGARTGREKVKQALPALPHNPVTPSHLAGRSLATCWLSPWQKSEVQSVTPGGHVQIPTSLLHSRSLAAAAAPPTGGGGRAWHINDAACVPWPPASLLPVLHLIPSPVVPPTLSHALFPSH